MELIALVLGGSLGFGIESQLNLSCKYCSIFSIRATIFALPFYKEALPTPTTSSSPFFLFGEIDFFSFSFDFS
jgi:hypothetical protein